MDKKGGEGQSVRWHSLDFYDNHQCPHLHLVNRLYQYLAMLIVTKNKKPNRPLLPPLSNLFTVSLSTFAV